jgi:hypothetical protein
VVFEETRGFDPMPKKLPIALAVAASVLGVSAARAQGSLSQQCAAAPSAAQSTCFAIAQAAASAQPALGIALAGGNATLGTASTGGVHLGVIPRVSGTLRVNGVYVRLPDVLEKQSATGTTNPVNGKLRLVIPAVNATATVGVFPGISVAPTIGGVGAIDLVGSASMLPLGLANGFSGNPVSWGGGVRVGLLRESFTMPGVSATVMYRRLPTVDLGDVCPSGSAGAAGAETCAGGGNAGEAHFGLRDWSTRVAVSKRLLAIGLAAGVGYDRFRSDVAYAYRYNDPVTGVAQVRRATTTLSSRRVSAFADASLNLLIASATLEAGWMRGGDPIQGYDASSTGFDPKKGMPFASLGVRVGL